jgi:hypothetical protein
LLGEELEARVATIRCVSEHKVFRALSDEVARDSVAKVEYHAEVARGLGAIDIDIHPARNYGDKPPSLIGSERNIAQRSYLCDCCGDSKPTTALSHRPICFTRATTLASHWITSDITEDVMETN